MDESCVKLLKEGEKTRSKGSCCNGVLGFLLYILKEVEAIVQLN